MQIKNLLMLAFLLASVLAWANSTPIHANTRYEISATNICDIPAPGNFHVEQIGATWVELAWDFQTEAVGGYRIRTYRASDNSLINTIFLGQITTTATVGGLDPETEYYSVINSICENGENSAREVVQPFFTLILDLIVNGYQARTDYSICTISASGNSCEFSNDPSAITSFKVERGEESLIFGVSRVEINPDQSRFKIHLKNENNYEKFRFYCGPVDAPDCSGILAVVKYAINGIETTVATLSVVQQYSTNSLLTANSIEPSVRIHKMLRYPNGGGGFGRPSGPSTHFIRTRDNGALETSPLAAASPNPFSETLDVYPNLPEANNIYLQLFNLSGQKVLDQQFAGGQEQYTLSTANLANGFYLLRIEADGEVQTLKVVKSE